MKIFNALFGIHFILSTILIAQPTLSPSNTIIISDVNDVIIQDSAPLRWATQLKSFFFKKKYIPHTLSKNKDLSPHGNAFYLLHLGMRKPYIASYISWIIDYLGQANHFIDGTEKIYRYLKDTKGYSIIFATNLDRTLYDITALSVGTAFTNLADKVFVSQQKNSPELIAQLQAFAKLPTTSISYKILLQKVLDAQPTETIAHVPSKKPDSAYYEYVTENIGVEKNMIFIDDRIENVDGFQALQDHAPAQRIAIEFKNPEQLANAFIALGILSEIEDHKLLEEIRYPRWWNKIQRNWKRNNPLFFPH